MYYVLYNFIGDRLWGPNLSPSNALLENQDTKPIISELAAASVDD